MPIYTYINLTTQQEFEVVQSMSETRLTVHPETGDPVRRIITPSNIATKHTTNLTKKLLSNENVAAKGFTRYEKAGNGHYVRTAGTQGPAEFRK